MAGNEEKGDFTATDAEGRAAFGEEVKERAASTDAAEQVTLAAGSEILGATLANAETLLESDAEAPSSESGGALLESGDSLGRLEVGEILGQGAFGIVVAAFDPQLKRKLAIKLLRPEVFESKSGRDAHKRLLREARAMAKISHVNVVTVHDIGTVDGQVYIAMEFVEGGNLGAWLEKQERGWQQIIEVFLQAGRGLAAAHREGLVHRDFKPDNVLVNTKDEVRVADFGLVSISEKRGEAIASGELNLSKSSSSDDLDLTRAGSMMGTALYMSPEQHLGDEVTPASDQFSFCVALYSALYKRGPFPARNYKELRKAVITGAVLAPPTNTSIPKWIQAVLRRGLSLEVEDRYPSMPALLEALCQDLGARRRRRLKLAAASIAGGLVLSALFWSRGEEKRVCQDAQASLDNVWDGASRKAVTAAFAGERSAEYPRFEQSISHYTDAWVSARTQVCEATHVRGEQSGSLLDQRMACLDERLHYLDKVLDQLGVGVGPEALDRALQVSVSLGDPADCARGSERAPRVPLPEDVAQREEILRANRLVDEAKAFADLGSQAKAIELLEAMLKEAPDYSPMQARANSVLGKSKVTLGELADGEKFLRESIEQGTRAGDDTLVASSWLALMQLDGIEREDYARGYEHGKMAGLAMARGQASPLDMALLEHSRASIMIFEGKSGEALALLESILPLVEEQGSASEISSVRSSLGDAATAERKIEDALAHYKLALAKRESALGSNHPENIYILNNMAVALKSSGDIAGARQALERSLAITERSYGDSVRAVVPILNNLGNIYRREGELDVAKAALQRAMTVGKAKMEEGHPLVTKAMLNLGIVLASEKDYPGATKAFREVLARSQAQFDEDHPDKAMALNNLGESLFLEEKFDESLQYSLLALDMKVRIHGQDHPRIASTLVSLGNTYQSMGQSGEAQAHFEKALELFHGAAGETHPRTILTLSLLGRLHESKGRAAKAVRYLNRAIVARGGADRGLDQAKDRFALVRALARTKGNAAARSMATVLQGELEGETASSELAAELARWIEAH